MKKRIVFLFTCLMLCAILYAQQLSAVPEGKVNTPSLSTISNTTFEIPVITDNIQSCDGIITYRFDFNYDEQKMRYLDYSTDGTLIQNGSVQINFLPGKLSVSWTGETPLNGSGPIIKLIFKAQEAGSTSPAMMDCLFNADTIKNIGNGTIAIAPLLGDVDYNAHIQMLDAALSLQYSVGLDPFPGIDPLPWDDWRITAANVDGQGGITAYDASLILQHTEGIIPELPDLLQGKKLSSPAVPVDVEISVEDGFIVFRSVGEIYGLNVFVGENRKFLGIPQEINTNMIAASNITSTDYAVALAAANAPGEREVLMRIPFLARREQSLIFKMIVNTQVVQVSLGLLSGIENSEPGSCIAYPNPASSVLYFRNPPAEATVSVHNLQGSALSVGSLNNGQLDISGLASGIYFIKVMGDRQSLLFKITKE